MNEFWRHSLRVACTCHTLAARFAEGVPGEQFVAGLLHDIGKLLLLQDIPVDYRELLLQADHGSSLVAAEQILLGFDHAEAGGRLLSEWQLPALLVEAVSSHHKTYPRVCGEGIVAIANALVSNDWNDQAVDKPDIPDEEEILASSDALFTQLSELVL
jgi:HD-like signal output (HDOD) protein